MATFKRLSVFMAVFALLGVVGVTLVTPSIVGWYNAPGAGGAMCNCAEMARSTAATIIQTQLVGLGLGALLGLMLGMVILQRQKQHALAAAPASPPPATPPPPA
jgi:hypothetical protein